MKDRPVLTRLLAKESLSGERPFGLLWTAGFGALAMYAQRNDWPPTTVFGLGLVALGILVVTATAPKALAPFNRAWLAFGHLVNRLVSPLVLGLIFFVLIAPIAIVARALGRDELRLGKRRAASYWVTREPPGPTGESFKNQF